MILSTERPGSRGRDLWASTRATTKDLWSAPVNLGPTVNSAGADGAPALSWDGTTLFFFSARPGGFGANDRPKQEITLKKLEIFRSETVPTA